MLIEPYQDLDLGDRCLQGILVNIGTPHDILSHFNTAFQHCIAGGLWSFQQKKASIILSVFNLD